MLIENLSPEAWLLMRYAKYESVTILDDVNTGAEELGMGRHRIGQAIDRLRKEKLIYWGVKPDNFCGYMLTARGGEVLAQLGHMITYLSEDDVKALQHFARFSRQDPVDLIARGVKRETLSKLEGCQLISYQSAIKRSYYGWYFLTPKGRKHLGMETP